MVLHVCYIIAYEGLDDICNADLFLEAFGLHQ